MGTAKFTMSVTGDERSTKINEHECESDEDCEVYFLKPVNEYNIVDKIKEANKELFAASVNDGEVNAVHVDANRVGNATALAVRKVTFAFNLEDYEPETEYAVEKGGETTQQSVAKATFVSELPAKLRAGLKFPAIGEETLTEHGTSGNEKEALEDERQEEAVNSSKQSSIKECTQQPSMSIIAEEPVERTEPIADQSALAGLDQHSTVDEICEEICMLSIDSCGRPLSDNFRRIMKQATFDYDDQYQEDDHDEENSKSLTNLLTSDYQESDDDDNLSIIVATYIPDDYERALLNTLNEEEQTALSAKRSHNSGQLRKISLAKRFPMRRNSYASTNSIGQKTTTAHLSSTSQHSEHRVPKLPPEVTKLKLNYKTCCEFRHAVLEKLPKYTGYLSEYGLNREQRQQRANQAAKKQHYVLEQTLRMSDQDMRKMKDNERAFTTWLKNKMRFPINKTRNMFDVKLS